MKTVLITGATGYVGTHLVDAYLDRGYRVVAVSRTPEALAALAKSHAGKNLAVQPLDITDSQATHDVVAASQPDVIVHAAAYPRRKAGENMDAAIAFEDTPLYKLNVGGMRNVAQAAVDLGRPVHLSIISSGAAFDQALDHVTVDSARNMTEPFARSKNLGELEVEKLVSAYPQVKTSILYPPVVLDTSQSKGIIPFSAQKALRGETIENNAHADAGMNMLLAEDLGKTIIAVTERQQQPFTRYPITGYRIPTKELLQKVAVVVAKRTGKQVDVKDGAATMRGMPNADESAIRSLLGADYGWQPIDNTMEAIVSSQPLPPKSEQLPQQPIDIMAAIRTVYPDATPGQIKAAVSDPAFLKAAYGDMPGYSGLSGPMLQVVKTSTVGSFALCYGNETGAASQLRSADPLVVLIKRAEKGPNGEDRFGALGGYIDLGKEKTGGEQPIEGMVREVGEEAVNDKGEPVVDLKKRLQTEPDLAKLLVSGVDYRRASLPVTYHGHAVELTTQELAALKIHSQRMESDDVYRAAVLEKSNGEVSDLRLVPLSEALKLSRDSFTHPHEFDALTKLSEHIKQQQTVVKR